MKEKLAEKYAQEKSSSSVFKEAHKKDFIAGWDACFEYLNIFVEGEEVEVTDNIHYSTNMWFTRKFIQKDSDGKFACRQINGTVCRWDYIRKKLDKDENK